MTGIIITVEKEELASLVQNAIESALSSLGLKKELEQEDVIIADDVCQWLNIKKSALYQMTHYGNIPFMKTGKRIYFSRKELRKWLEGGRKFTVAERNEQADERLSAMHKNRIKSNK